MFFNKNKKKTILIDPGHGLSREHKFERPLMHRINDKKVIVVPNSMSATENDHNYDEYYYREDHGNLLLAMEVIKGLEDLGCYNVKTTRTDNRDAIWNLSEEFGSNHWKDTRWKEYNWTQLAQKKWKVDTFVSLHTNAGGGTGVSGIYASKKGEKLARDISNEITRSVDFDIRRIFQHKYLILRKVKNSCLIEAGFHDSAHDLPIIIDERAKIAQAIVDGIHKNLTV